jgi:hypothetical protein
MGDDIVALPDVNTENAQVQQMLSQWIQQTVPTFAVVHLTG